MAEQIHPHEIMADFVNKYEAQIKPYLGKGEMPEGLKAIIMEHHMRYEIMEKLPTKPNSMAKAYHRLALNFLLGLTKNLEEYSSNIFNYSTGRIEAQVKELDTILKNDSNYKLYREELK